MRTLGGSSSSTLWGRARCGAGPTVGLEVGPTAPPGPAPHPRGVPVEGQLIGHGVCHGLRVGCRARAAAEDSVVDGGQFVCHPVGHVGPAGHSGDVTLMAPRQPEVTPRRRRALGDSSVMLL